MSRARFKVPDLPADRPKVPEVLTLARAYVRKPGNGAAGKCHVVLDDYNFNLGDIDFCLTECERAGDQDGTTIMSKMRQMTRSQRFRVCDGTYRTKETP